MRWMISIDEVYLFYIDSGWDALRQVTENEFSLFSGSLSELTADRGAKPSFATRPNLIKLLGSLGNFRSYRTVRSFCSVQLTERCLLTGLSLTILLCRLHVACLYVPVHVECACLDNVFSSEAIRTTVKSSRQKGEAKDLSNSPIVTRSTKVDGGE